MLTIDEAARFLEVDRTVVYTFVNDHDFPSIKEDTVWKVRKDELEEWLKNVPCRIIASNKDNVMNNTPFLNVPETAKYFNIPLVRAYELVPTFSFPSVKLGNQWKVFKDKLDDWAKDNPVLLLSLQRPIKETKSNAVIQ